MSISPYLNVIVGLVSLIWGLTHIGLYIKNKLVIYYQDTNIIKKFYLYNKSAKHHDHNLSVNLLEEQQLSEEYEYEHDMSLDDLFSIPTNEDIFIAPLSTNNTTTTNEQHIQTIESDSTLQCLNIPNTGSDKGCQYSSRRPSVLSADPEELEHVVSELRCESTYGAIRKLLPMIILSEIGDKSMLTSLVLASTYSLYSVCLGVISGVVVTILIAAVFGQLSSIYKNYLDYDLISAIVMTIVGVYTLVT